MTSGLYTLSIQSWPAETLTIVQRPTVVSTTCHCTHRGITPIASESFMEKSPTGQFCTPYLFTLIGVCSGFVYCLTVSVSGVWSEL
jgi:hypothetical protein